MSKITIDGIIKLKNQKNSRYYGPLDCTIEMTLEELDSLLVSDENILRLQLVENAISKSKGTDKV